MNIQITGHIDGFKVMTPHGDAIFTNWGDVVAFIDDQRPATTHRDILNQFATDAVSVMQATLMNVNQFDLTDDRRRGIVKSFDVWAKGWIDGLDGNFDKPVK